MKSVKATQDTAVLEFYGAKKVTINGKPIAEYEGYKSGGLFDPGHSFVVLTPGEYTIIGTYDMTSNMGRTNNKAKDISVKADLQAGKNYDIGLFEGEYELEVAAAFTELDKSGWYVILRNL